MTTRCFRRTILGLFGVVILLLGILNFEAWNQKGGEEGSLVLDSSGQPEMGGGQKESEAPPGSKPAGGARSRGKLSGGKEKGQDKSASEPAKDAKTYQLDTKASRVYVRVGSATKLGHPHGVEGRLKSGRITPGAGGELVFDMRSFKADTQQARKRVRLEGKPMSENEAKKVNETMLSADVLDVEKYPTATYQITMMKPAEEQEAGAPGTYHVNGRLTLHGAKQPLHLKAKLARAGEGALKLSGVFAIEQTAYGIKPYSAAGGLAKVADELEILAELSLGPEK
jgi:polyisoprenoid-binding protein YceI